MADKNSDFILRMLERLDEKMDDLASKYAEQRVQFDIHTRSDVKSDETIKEEVVNIKEALIKHSAHLEEYNQQLKEHIRRTELLESRIQPIEEDYTQRKAKESFLESRWKKFSVSAAIISGLAGAAWYLYQLYSKLHP